ncbi:outer membrane homotrimeric porin [Desulfolutivibrio sulfodismutans]|nr:outer membrane homotrimeric porin [Desulfolutivibrio sulfodismutans]QLA12805.1 outer membrane homotrimeric porin [Desulfolutivibrio sulfodismutans DSM 3696]
MARLAVGLAAALVWTIFSVAPGRAAEIRAYGDFRVHGNFFQNQNFTGWNGTGAQTEDPVVFFQRLRLHFDLPASDALSFRLGLRLNNEIWGQGPLAADSSVPDIEPYQAYLQFAVPDTDLRLTVGYQPLSMPHTPVFYDSVVLSTDSGNSDTAAVVLSGPLAADILSGTLGYGRLVDANGPFDPSTTQTGDEFDLFFATLDLTLPGVTISPFGMAGVLGRGAALGGMGDTLLSAGTFLAGGGFAHNQNPAVWTGAAVIVDALAPFKMYADVAFGDVAFTDRAINRRSGWFVDAALEYGGWSWVTPQVFGWWGSGEDASLTNGSERLPSIDSSWGPICSFLFDGDQELHDTNMDVTPQGSMGLSFGLNQISLIPDLTSLAGVTVAAGTSSPAGLRKAVAATGGPGAYVQMGNDLAQGETLLSAYFNHSYAITQALDLVLETGWARGYGFHKSIWGRRMVDKAGDVFQGGLGFIYHF